VQRYLETKFGADLETARNVMTELAASFQAADLAHRAYGLYKTSAPRSRPASPAGVPQASSTSMRSATSHPMR
jgi:hypothetical protein